MKDVYAGRVTKFHSLPLTMHWLTSSSTKCVNQRSWFYFRLMICSVLVPVKTKPTDRSFVITTDPEKPLLKLVGKTCLLFCLWGYKAEGSPTEDLKSLSKCIAQPGTNLLPPLLILEIMCTYAFREKKKKRAVTHCCVTPICMLEERCWYKWCYRGQKRAYTSGESVPGYPVKMHQSLGARLCPDLNPGLVLLILQEEEIETESDSTAFPTFCLLCFLNHVRNGLLWIVPQCFRYSFGSMF